MCGTTRSFWSECGHSTLGTTCSTPNDCRIEPHTSTINPGICINCQDHLTTPLSKKTREKLQSLVLRDIEKENKLWVEFEEGLAAESFQTTITSVSPNIQITLTEPTEAAQHSTRPPSDTTIDSNLLSVGYSWKAAYNREHKKVLRAEKSIAKLREKQGLHDDICKVLSEIIERKDEHVETLIAQTRVDGKEIEELRARLKRFEEEEEGRRDRAAGKL